MRRLFIVPVGLLVLLVIGFIIGFAGQAPFITLLSVICAAPMFLLATGFAIGKASHNYTFFVPKAAQPVIQQQRARRPAATYEVNSGEYRGN